MPNPPRRSVFRMPGVTPVEARLHSRVRVVRDGGATFHLSLPMLNQIDEWAAKQTPPASRTEAIDRLLRRALSS